MLLILDGDEIVLGKPFVEGARVIFSVLDQTKRRKIIVQHYRPKTGYIKTVGHRQPASQLQVELIEGGGKRDERVAEKKKSKKAKEKKSEAKVEATVTEPRRNYSPGITGDYFGELSWHIKRDKDLHRTVATVFPRDWA